MDRDSNNIKNALDIRPLPPYRGDEPYICVCYDLKDYKEAFAEIRRFQDLNHNVFYDEDISSANVNVDDVLPRIEGCEVFVILVSNNATASKDVKSQFRRAISEGKPMLAIYLEDEDEIEMSSGWKYELLDIRQIRRGPDEESYVSQLADAIQNLKDNAGEEESADSYDDEGEYLYVSYDYNDYKPVYKEVRRLKNMGCSVRWDVGEGPSVQRHDSRLTEIEGCSLVIVFLSKNSIDSDKVTEEVMHAIAENKAILPIYIESPEDVNIEGELKQGLSNLQALFRCGLDEGEFTSRFSESLQNFGILPKDPTNSKLIPGVGREPLPAYGGDNPYIFVSYAHKDSYRVFPEIKRFQDWDYNVWYDEGIAPASEWLEDVVDHLDKCALFLIFVTKNSVASVNVKKEIKYAVHEGKPVVQIFLDDFDELEKSSEWKYLLDEIQGIPKTQMSEEEYIYKCTYAFEKRGFQPYPDDLFRRVELKNPSDLLMENAFKYATLYSDIDSRSIGAYVDEFFDNLELESDVGGDHFYKEILKSSIDSFLESKYVGNALDVYRIFFSIYQIGEENLILDLVEDIGIGGPDDLQTNHLIHCVNVFVLGLAMYSQNERLRGAFRESILESGFKKHLGFDEEFLYRWAIASLLHDIYMPYERNGKRLNRELYEKLNRVLAKDRGIDDFNDLNMIYKSNPYFSDGYDTKGEFDPFKPTDIMANRVCTDFGYLKFKTVKGNLNNLVRMCNEVGFEEHGLAAALLVLNAYSYQIQEYDDDPSPFYCRIVDSATAILLHTYYGYFLRNPPFRLPKMSLQDNPLAFLLILCDNILEFYKKHDYIGDNGANLLSIIIDNDSLSVSSHVKSSSFGFGFSNELAVDEILDAASMFDDMKSENDNDVPNVFKADAVSKSSMEFIEKVAIIIHHQYDTIDFNDLVPWYKISSVRLATEVPISLASIGYEIAYLDDERQAIRKFSEEEIDELAIFEHEHWLEERMNRGWTFGPERDDERRVSPAIVPWSELADEFRVQNTDFAQRVPEIVDELGFKITLSKFSILAAEIANSYDRDNEVIFRDLSIFERRFLHKKLDLIVESLFKLGYRIVDWDGGTEGYDEASVEFDKQERKYFAQSYHDEWCELYTSLNWRYGEYYDSKSKTHPELVSWHDLTVKSANRRINIFKNLPKLCKKAGLIIYRKDIWGKR